MSKHRAGTRWTVADAEQAYSSAVGGVCPDGAAKPGGYRTMDVYMGSRVEVSAYPWWDTRPASGVRAAKLKPSRAAQQRQNAKDSSRRFCALLECNFGAQDYHLTGTYDIADGPLPDIDRVQRDVRNMILRWQRLRHKAGLDKGRYMYVIEGAADGSRQQRIHAHVIMAGGLPWETMTGLWQHGRVRVDRLQPDDYGLMGLGRYLSKDPRGRKRWGASRGLRQPRVVRSNNRISRRDVAAIEVDRYAAREIVARKYPGYMIRDPERDVRISYSPYVSGAYLTIQLTPIRRSERQRR